MMAEQDLSQEPLNAPFLNGLFSSGFSEVKRPLRTKSVKRPIKVGKRPINEGKRPIKAMVLVGISVGCLMGCFCATRPWWKTAPRKRPTKRSMIKNFRGRFGSFLNFCTFVLELEPISFCRRTTQVLSEYCFACGSRTRSHLRGKRNRTRNHQGVLQGVAFRRVQVLREKRPVSLHEKRVRSLVHHNAATQNAAMHNASFSQRYPYPFFYSVIAVMPFPVFQHRP